jgi:hypothetical protein
VPAGEDQLVRVGIMQIGPGIPAPARIDPHRPASRSSTRSAASKTQMPTGRHLRGPFPSNEGVPMRHPGSTGDRVEIPTHRSSRQVHSSCDGASAWITVTSRPFGRGRRPGSQCRRGCCSPHPTSLGRPPEFCVRMSLLHLVGSGWWGLFARCRRHMHRGVPSRIPSRTGAACVKFLVSSRSGRRPSSPRIEMTLPPPRWSTHDCRHIDGRESATVSAASAGPGNRQRAGPDCHSRR